MRSKSGNSLQVIAVRVELAIEQRLRLLAETTGRSQSFFLKQLIEKGIDAMEDTAAAGGGCRGPLRRSARTAAWHNLGSVRGFDFRSVSKGAQRMRNY